jgi:hypothetical protein
MIPRRPEWLSSLGECSWGPCLILCLREFVYNIEAVGCSRETEERVEASVDCMAESKTSCGVDLDRGRR